MQYTKDSEDKKEYKSLRVAFYLRVSSEDQVEKYGLDMQREALEALIKSKGLYPDGTSKYVLAGEEHIYVEAGVSGTYLFNERPASSLLMENLEFSKERPFDVIAVYKIDRLARRLRILLDVISFFKKHKVTLISANESIDTNTPFGRAILGIIGVIAELEIETTKERTQAGRKLATSKTGVIMGGVPEYGYIKDIKKRRKLLEPEAEIVKRIFFEFVYSDKSPEKIRFDLTNDNVLSPDASALKFEKRKGSSKKKNKTSFWSDATIRSIIKNKVYLGLYYYGKSKKGKKISEDKWKLSEHRHTAIIDIKTFEMAQKRLKKRSNNLHPSQRKSNNHVYLLSSVLKCDYCKDLNDGQHHHWNGSRKKLDTDKFSYSYICGRKNSSKFSTVCTALPIPAKQFEEYIVSFVRNLISNPKHIYDYQNKLNSNKLANEHLTGKIQTFRNFINSAPQRIANLKSQHEEGIIASTSELKEKIDEVNTKSIKFEEELNKLQVALTGSEIQDNYVRSLEEFSIQYASSMDELFKDRMKTRNIIQALIKEIIIYSRPIDDKDVIAGVKKRKKGAKPRVIPNSIQIVLNLPIDLLTRLAIDFHKDNPNKEGFLVGKDDL